MPTDRGEFTLDTDASNFATGAVLSQKQKGIERVVAYASRSLDRREQNYCVTRKELLAVVHFLRFFKQYLLGRSFRVRTDHAALSWLKRTPDPIGQQARWLEQMEEFDFVVEHRSGKRHGNADAMSRRPCLKKDCVCREENRLEETNEFTTGLPIFGGPADHQRSAWPGGHEGLIDDSPSAVDEMTSYSTQNQIVVVADVHREDVRTPDISPGRNSDDDVQTTDASTDTVICARIRVRNTTSRPSAESNANSEIHNDTGGPAPDTVLPWSKEGLRLAQMEDIDIGFVIEKLNETPERPNWESVALRSQEVKTLWSMWERLSVRDGMLKRRFEALDGLSEKWQVVWPKKMRMEFMQIAHGGMTGGHLGRRRTAVAIQSRAYWPTWSSDFDHFMNNVSPVPDTIAEPFADADIASW